MMSQERDVHLRVINHFHDSGSLVLGAVIATRSKFLFNLSSHCWVRRETPNHSLKEEERTNTHEAQSLLELFKRTEFKAKEKPVNSLGKEKKT